MARTSMRANDAFVLGFLKNVHDGTIARSPIAFSQAVHQKDINVFGVEFAPEALEVGTHFVRIARPGFCEDSDFAAVDMFERFGDVRMASVGIGGVEKTQAAVVA